MSAPLITEPCWDVAALHRPDSALSTPIFLLQSIAAEDLGAITDPCSGKITRSWETMIHSGAAGASGGGAAGASGGGAAGVRCHGAFARSGEWLVGLGVRC